MRKIFLLRALRLLLLLSLVPGIYLFWESGASDRLLGSVRPPMLVQAVRMGTPAPDFFVPAARMWNKQDFRLSSVKGFPVILHFWATWCGPCLQELPELLRLAETLRPQGYTFIAVALDDSWATVEGFFVQYPHLRALTDRMALVLDPSGEVANIYGSVRYPETFLINDQMVVDNKFIGAQPWNDKGMAPYLQALRSAPKP